MAKKIKFALEMADGYKTRTLEDLRTHFNLEKVMGYFLDGKLQEWLTDRYYDTEAATLQGMDKTAADFPRNLCAALGVAYEGSGEDTIDLAAVARLNEKRAYLQQQTNDADILMHVPQTALTQEDLADLLDDGVRELYLCGDVFTIPMRIGQCRYIGILGKPEVQIAAQSLEDLADQDIVFENVLLPKKLRAMEIQKHKEVTNLTKTFNVGGYSLTAKEVLSLYNFYAKMMTELYNGQVPMEADGTTYDGDYNADILELLPKNNDRFIGGWYNRLFALWLANDMQFRGSVHALLFRHKIVEGVLYPAFEESRNSLFFSGRESGYEKMKRMPRQQPINQAKPVEAKPAEKPKQEKPVEVKPNNVAPKEKNTAAYQNKAVNIPFGIEELAYGTSSLCDKIVNNAKPTQDRVSIDIFSGICGNETQPQQSMGTLPPEVMAKLSERETDISKVNALLEKIKKESVSSGCENPAIAYMNGDPKMAQTMTEMQQQLGQLAQQVPIKYQRSRLSSR